MSFATEVRKLTDTKTFYAVAGCTDLAVEKLREVPDHFQHVQGEVQTRVQGQLRELPRDRTELQQRALTYADSVASSLASRASTTYDELARRGYSVVGRVRQQEALQELESRARTVSQQTKAAATSARKTASSATRAAQDSARQVG